MDSAAVVIAGLGIVGTLAGAALSPLLNARSSRRERRTQIYAETLAGIWQLRDNAITLSAVPAATQELDKPSFERLRHLDAEARLVAGDQVRAQLQTVIDVVNEFERELWLPHLHHRTATIEADHAELIRERMALGEIADRLAVATRELEERMRDDVARVTQDLAHRFEQLIRAQPEHWHLMQPKWPSDR